jgi:molybdenum cofactor guanylyltransferase
VRLLGAILAGGASSRFGSDKALAHFDGRMLLEHAAAQLRPHVDAIVVVGREWPGLASIADRPRPGLGPLGGLSGALAHANAHGFDAVLTASCDAIGLDAAAVNALIPGPAILDAQPVIGLWPADLASDLDAWLTSDHPRSVYAFADHVVARRVHCARPPANINTPDDLARLEPFHGI